MSIVPDTCGIVGSLSGGGAAADGASWQRSEASEARTVAADHQKEVEGSSTDDNVKTTVTVDQNFSYRKGEGQESGFDAESVSYTHLTLPTKLIV